MSKRDELIEKYAKDLKEKCNVKPDMDFLRAVTIGCGPSIYNRDSASVSSSSEKELETVRKNFIGKKLGVTDEKKAEKALANAIETYGKSTKVKYRAVMYYLIAKDLKKESVYKK